MDLSKHIQKAEESLRRRNYDFAVEIFRQLIDLDPDQGEARAGLRQALKKRFETKRGGKFLRAVSGALPLSRAKTFAKLGKHEACAKALEDYLLTNPLDEEANLLLGASLEACEYFNAARAVYEFTAEIAPKNSDALRRAGAMMYHTGENERSLEYYERALAADPRDQEALKARKNLAAALALETTSKSGAGHSREMIKDQEGAIQLERARKVHLSDDELKDQLATLEDRFADTPSDPDLMLQISEVHEKLKDPEAALEFAQRALEYRRDSFDLTCKVGDLESKVLKKKIAGADRDGRSDEATELEKQLIEHDVLDYRRRVDIRPGDAVLVLKLAKRLVRADEVDSALEELQKCQSEPRVRAEALFLLGKCFQQKGILDLARMKYEGALEGRNGTDERAKEILYNLGSIAEAEGNSDEARSRYIQIYEVDINYRDVAAKMGSFQ